MSIESRLQRLEDSTGMDGECRCPRNTVVYGAEDDEPYSTPPADPALCPTCGRPLIVVLVEYTNEGH